MRLQIPRFLTAFVFGFSVTLAAFAISVALSFSLDNPGISNTCDPYPWVEITPKGTLDQL